MITFDDEGDEYHSLDGRLHRLDGPAVIRHTGTKSWYRHGSLHRDGEPAINHSDGSKSWYQNGLLHREDGPAVEWSNGANYWYLGGKSIQVRSLEEFLECVRIWQVQNVLEA